FWSKFDPFQPDPIAAIAGDFDRLTIHQGCQGHSMKTKGHRRRRAQYIEAEFEKHFGSNTTKLETWQDLCGEVGVKPVPESITKCKKALKHVHINIINLLDHRRSGGLIPLMKFKSGKALREYTMNGHIFPLVYAKADGFIKIFLRQIL
ncbi:hypothetical protein CC78DRAFT_461471, partial [Lojkania enalia]